MHYALWECYHIRLQRSSEHASKKHSQPASTLANFSKKLNGLVGPVAACLYYACGLLFMSATHCTRMFAADLQLYSVKWTLTLHIA